MDARTQQKTFAGTPAEIEKRADRTIAVVGAETVHDHAAVNVLGIRMVPTQPDTHVDK
jgi:hypothetical protein